MAVILRLKKFIILIQSVLILCILRSIFIFIDNYIFLKHQPITQDKYSFRILYHRSKPKQERTFTKSMMVKSGAVEILISSNRGSLQRYLLHRELILSIVIFFPFLRLLNKILNINLRSKFQRLFTNLSSRYNWVWFTYWELIRTIQKLVLKLCFLLLVHQ